MLLNLFHHWNTFFCSLLFSRFQKNFTDLSFRACICHTFNLRIFTCQTDNLKKNKKKTLNFICFTTITHSYKLATRWSCWVENKYKTFSVRENHWNFFPGCKTLTHSCWLWDSNPQPPSNSVVVITPRLAHRPNHSATELWQFYWHWVQCRCRERGVTDHKSDPKAE